MFLWLNHGMALYKNVLSIFLCFVCDFEIFFIFFSGNIGVFICISGMATKWSKYIFFCLHTPAMWNKFTFSKLEDQQILELKAHMY
jgi:hypothetical protein